METVINVERVKKQFLKKEVLQDLSFDVTAGECVALLGCNGAGKTTTINILLGLEKADKGQVNILGGKPGETRVKSELGVTPQGTDFPEGLKVKEILNLVAAHYSNPLPPQEAIEKFHLKDIAHQLTVGLSYGQKRRLAVALAFIGRPKLVFLDEPTTGLDVQSRHALWKIIQDYVSHGGTLLLTTHYLEEAEKLASKVLVLDQGKIRAEGTVDEIIAESGMPSVTFLAPSCPTDLTNAKNIKHNQGQYVIETTDSDALIRDLVERQVAFENLFIHKSSLETAFLEMDQKGDHS